LCSIWNAAIAQNPTARDARLALAGMLLKAIPARVG